MWIETRNQNAVFDENTEDEGYQRMLIRWFLSLTPMERLERLEESLKETPPEERIDGSLLKLDKPLIVWKTK